MKIYVISLERAVERRSRVESVLAARGIDFEFFNAVNGFEGLPERLQALPDDQHRIRFRSRPLTPGEKGCYASHFLLWEKCVEFNEPILILEDDFLPTQYFEEVLGTLPKVHEQYEYVKVEPQVGSASALTTIDNMQLMFWHNNSCWTTGYSISPQGARRLLAHSKRWLCSVDNFIGNTIVQENLYGLTDPTSGPDAQAALAFLKSVGKGELALGLAADGEQLESQNLAQLQSDGRVFGRGSGGFL